MLDLKIFSTSRNSQEIGNIAGTWPLIQSMSRDRELVVSHLLYENHCLDLLICND
jgi:hypothetical protein